MGGARIGVLSLQGGFAAHERALAEIGHEPAPVRRPEDLEGVAGLVFPGGESTAQLRLLERAGLIEPLDRAVRGGLPVLATCAGLILAARRVTGPDQRSFGWIDAVVARNAWGRQVDSFEATADGLDLRLMFIRAPRILEIGPGVEVLAALRGEPVLIRQGRVVAATFHPELTGETRVHRWAFGPAGSVLDVSDAPMHRLPREALEQGPLRGARAVRHRVPQRWAPDADPRDRGA
jgi:5'-phosphate synthase pdxT subunit